MGHNGLPVPCVYTVINTGNREKDSAEVSGPHPVKLQPATGSVDVGVMECSADHDAETGSGTTHVEEQTTLHETPVQFWAVPREGDARFKIALGRPQDGHGRLMAGHPSLTSPPQAVQAQADCAKFARNTWRRRNMRFDPVILG